MKYNLLSDPLRYELRFFLRELMEEIEEQKKREAFSVELFTINQVAKMLGRSHSTINRLVEDGVIISTDDGMISGEAIELYLKVKELEKHKQIINQLIQQKRA